MYWGAIALAHLCCQATLERLMDPSQPPVGASASPLSMREALVGAEAPERGSLSPAPHTDAGQLPYRTTFLGPGSAAAWRCVSIKTLHLARGCTLL